MSSSPKMPLDRESRINSFGQSSNIPASYVKNSTSEDKLLKYTDDFKVLYHKYFPDRRTLLLTPVNECGQRKMICTFIRPTAMRFDEMYDLEQCSAYVAGYMQYEPLHPETCYDEDNDDTVECLPGTVVSPATALQWQVGNCLEMSLVLTSLLCGAGYNAYVVVGYAQRAVCLNDQTERLWADTLPIEYNSDDEEEPATTVDAEYAALLKERPVLREAGAQPPASAQSHGTPQATASETSRMDGDSPALPTLGLNSITNHDAVMEVKAVHCWVAVLPGGRKSMKDTTFIEPSTGELIPILASDQFYTGVEAVFNDTKYYLNLHPEVPTSALKFDLKERSQWEGVLCCEGDEEDLHEGTAGGTMGALTGRRTLGDMTMVGGHTSTNLLDIRNKPNVVVPRSWTAELTLSPSQYESRYPDSYKVIQYADAVVRLYADYSQPDMRVKEVVLSDSLYDTLEQVHLFYKHRADKLRRRSIYPQLAQKETNSLMGRNSARSYSGQAAPSYRLLTEWYERGRMRDTSVEGLREFSHEPGVQRTMKFYWRAREDGMFKRTEVFFDLTSLRKVKEFYKGRNDHLCYRSASFDQPRTVRETNLHALIAAAGSGTGTSKEYPRLEPTRISQKFVRQPDLPYEKDVAKVTFSRPAAHDTRTTLGEMWIFFQYPEDSIIRPYHMFAKPSSNVEDYIAASAARKPIEPPKKIVSMPGAEPPRDLELYNERKWLTGVETICLTEIRSKMDEGMDVLTTMEADHSLVRQMLSSYDTLRNRPKETEAERAKKLAESIRREESRKDYLAPYIAKLEMPSDFDGDYLKVKLSSEQAKRVRDEALLELKERLIQRGHIMQSRMDKEKEDFNKRQLAYQRNRDSATVDGTKEAEDFAIYCKEATWRMKVLDERLSKHIDLASEKYAQLAQRLSEDARLTALYNM